jgi:hypothetical protein
MTYSRRCFRRTMLFFSRGGFPSGSGTFISLADIAVLVNLSVDSFLIISQQIAEVCLGPHSCNTDTYFSYYQTPSQWLRWAPSPGVKRHGREADHSPPFSAEVKKVTHKSSWHCA